MSDFDVMDERLIAAPVSVVFAELEALGRGDAGWFLPYMRVAPLSPRPAEVGGRSLVTIRRGPSFTVRIAAVERNHMIHVVYDGGAFRGQGRWLMETIEHGTRLRMHWQVTPQGLWRWLAHIIDIPKAHSRVIQAGFDGLSRHLARSNP